MESPLQIRRAIEALNAGFKADPQAVWTLMNTYTQANEALAEHPTIQVIERDIEGKPSWTVGPLGLLNGVLEAALGQRICIMTGEPDADGKRPLLGFDIYTPPEKAKVSEQAEILSRISGLDTTESEEAITAAVNTFTKEGLNQNQVINRLAAVDASFAVSAEDLAKSLTRVGDKAADASVSFDELIALTTVAQQITARGGEVIGNGLKTILERFNRVGTKQALRTAGIELVRKDGTHRTLIEVLKDVAKVQDPKLKVTLEQELAGVYQTNLFKAVVTDLAKGADSIFLKALEASENATDEAYQKNDAMDAALADVFRKPV